MNDNDRITIPRTIVERALEALTNCTCEYGHRCNRCDSEVDPDGNVESALRAALEQPKNHSHDVVNMVPSGWKLVPEEPTDDMREAGKGAHYEAETRISDSDAWILTGFAHRVVRASYIYRAMLAAAPQPPAPGCKATKRGDHVVCDDCKSAWGANDKNPPACVPAPPAVEQPQSEQPAMTPIAQRKLDDLVAGAYTISGYSVYHERKHKHGFVTGAGLVGWWKPEGMEYPQPQGEQESVVALADAIRAEPTELIRKWRVLELIKDHPRPQPKQEPLTDEEVKAICYTGPVYAPDGKVTRTPEQYKREIADARMHGIRQAERAHGIGGEK